MRMIQEIILWSIFSLSSVYAQQNSITPKYTVQLNSTTGMVNWPSMGSAEQNSIVLEDFLDQYYDEIQRTYENYSPVVEVGKEYILNGNECYMYGSLSMEKIDVTFELKYVESKMEEGWYQKLKKWGNPSITDEEISSALTQLYGVCRLISLSVDSVKPTGTGFETLTVLNNIAFAQKWSGEFGGTFNDPFHNSTLSLEAQNQQPAINFTKVTRVDLDGQSIRIVADRAIVTLEVSSLTLPLINTSITKGTLKLQGLKSIENPNNATSANPSLVFPLHAWWGVQYWPSVGTSEKIYGTASLEQIDIEIFALNQYFKNKSWYRIFQNWGKSSTRPITDEEISEAIDLVMSERVDITNISAESITGIGHGFESLRVLDWGNTAYAHKWKGTFGGSFRVCYGNLKPKPFSNQRILKFSNITKVELEGNLIRIVAAKAILSLDVSELYTRDGTVTLNRGSLTLEGFVSQTGFFVEHPILSITLITCSIVFLLLILDRNLVLDFRLSLVLVNIEEDVNIKIKWKLESC
ncbi:hypothetical protein BC833DRAFT_564861 [Globomyces pollinis-pini]|nr:hypothetical protein BC833DRAFT_564861 [Globomyces pollinis-pini]